VNYWLDLFTGTTWQEFRVAGATITGFRERTRTTSTHVHAGDVFLCYLTGVKRWVGALEVVRQSNDQRVIWADADFPVRFEVRSLVLLDAEHGIPMEDLEGKVSFFAASTDKGKYKGFVRGSPKRFKNERDAALILDLLRGAEKNPVYRPVDPKKLARKPYFTVERKTGGTTTPTVVSIPEPEPLEQASTDPTATTRHTEIQYHLLCLGADMGLDVWVAANDRNRSWNGRTLGQLPRLLETLPTQFDEATNRIIKLIDVLWLRGNAIVAAFEIECTTTVYSGLLRMSDLLALQPNLDIKLYLVAPDERRDKVENEMLRPTFRLREKPLTDVCGFISFGHFIAQIEGIRKLGLQSSLKPDFLQSTAEYFGEQEDVP
jgi:hypothetical protein